MLWKKTSALVWGCNALTCVWVVFGLVLGRGTDQPERVLITSLDTSREMRG